MVTSPFFLSLSLSSIVPAYINAEQTNKNQISLTCSYYDANLATKFAPNLAQANKVPQACCRHSAGGKERLLGRKGLLEHGALAI